MTGSIAQTKDPHSARCAEMATNRFEVVTSFLMACLLLLTCVAAVLSFVWFYGGEQEEEILRPEPRVKFVLATSGDRIDEDPFTTPSRHEAVELLEPALEQSLSHLVATASAVAATTSLGNGLDKGNKGGLSKGPENGDSVTSRFERWRLVFVTEDIQSYASQLDHFEIELAAIGGQPGVDVAQGFTAEPLVRTIDDPAQVKRPYFLYTQASALKSYDTELLQRAGISTAGRVILKFISSKFEDELALAEWEFAQSKGRNDVDDIERTVFQTTTTSGGFETRVVEQFYR